MFRPHHLNELNLAADRRPEVNRRRLGHRGASPLHRLSEVGADLAARLNPGPQPARLEGHRAERLRQVSEFHRPRRNLTGHQEADKARHQARGGLADLRTCQSKPVVEHPSSSAAEQRLQAAQVLVSVAAAQSADSLARRLLLLVQVNREAEKNADN